MPRFTIIPSDKSCAPSELVASDAGGVLHLVQRFDCHKADVLRDGAYCFSACLADSGVWTIFQREPKRTHRASPPARTSRQASA